MRLAHHRVGAAHVGQRHLLRRRDQHGAGDRRELRQRQLHVAGAGRKVHDQVVELAPDGLLDHLLQGAVQDRAAPGEGLTVLHQVRDRDQLHPVVAHREDVLLIVRHQALALDAEHLGLRRTVDVGVQKTDRGALEHQRGGEVRRDGGLADPALAGAHGDDVLHPGKRRGSPVAHLRAELEIDAGDAVDPADGVAHVLLDRGLHRAGGRGEVHLDVNGVPLHGRALDHAQRDEVLMELGVLHRLERLEDAGFLDRHGRSVARAPAPVNPLADTPGRAAARLADPPGGGYAPDVRGPGAVPQAQESTDRR